MKSHSPKPSLQTIADLLGLSRATVSLAMRNQASISVETRARVQAVAEEIGYRPNPMISSLMAHIKSGRPVPDSGVIAFLTSHDTAESWKRYSTLLRYFSGAQERAQQAGYRLEEVWLREPGMTPAKIRSILFNRGVEGILVAPTSAGSAHISMDLTAFAAATVGHSILRPKLHRAAHHHLEGLRIAVHQLRHLGYRSLGMAMNKHQDKRNSSIWTAAFLGYQQTLRASARIPILFTDHATEAELGAWLKRYKVDAVLAANSLIYPMLQNLGIKIPEELGLVVLDLSTTDHDISGIDISPELVGSAAMDMIVAQIHRNERGVPEKSKLLLTEGTWVPGLTIRRIPRPILRAP